MLMALLAAGPALLGGGAAGAQADDGCVLDRWPPILGWFAPAGATRVDGTTFELEGQRKTRFGASFDTEGMAFSVNGRTQLLAIVRGADFFLRRDWTTGPAEFSFRYGVPTDQPVAGNWDLDGVDEIAVLRATEGGHLWLERDSLTSGVADRVIELAGPPNVTPLAGDWNGDGLEEPGLYEQATARFYLYDRVGQLLTVFRFGRPGDVAFVGDWDGVGGDTPGIRRGNGPLYFFAIRNSNTSGPGHASSYRREPVPSVPLSYDQDSRVCG